MPRAASPNSIDTQIAKRVSRGPRGTVFTPAMFATLGSRAAIDKALQRQVAKGTLRRLSRGLYDKPRQDALLGTLWPSVDAVVKAVVGKDKLRVQPAGAYAANLLGLSEQVPAKIVMLTDGTTRTVRAGPLQIALKRTSPRNMAGTNRLIGLLIQALKNFGPHHITPQRVAHLRNTLPMAERAKLLADLDLAPAWMRPMLRDLAHDESSPATAKATRGPPP
jgi:Family of unknown function (DUF6088)